MLRKLLFVLSLTGCGWATPQLGGREWIPWDRARGQGERPILVLQMLGDLDEDWC
ncbi:hypothetical protein JST97_01870 [bacterium]|nr:hypothetical protein [bacterium]